MCLYSITCPQKAKKPIEVKKCINVLIKVDGENKECGKSLESPFMETPITSCMMLPFYKLSLKDILCFTIDNYVGRGFIHSYEINHKEPKDILRPSMIWVKAYIPKGEWYIKGINNDIASTQLLLDPRDVYKQTGYKFLLSDIIKFFLWRIIYLIK